MAAMAKSAKRKTENYVGVSKDGKPEVLWDASVLTIQTISEIVK